MKYLFIQIVLVCATLNLNGQKAVLHIPYPDDLPGSAVKKFLPGIVSKDSTEFGSAFSPDGKSFYFAISENKKSSIYVTHYEGERWTAPIAVPFNDAKYSTADPAFAADGKLYFISNRPKDESDSLFDYDIWFVTPLPGGGWTEPENLKSVNSDSDEFYISFSKKGNLFFSSSRKGGYGEEDIYMSRLQGTSFSAPVNLGSNINSNKSEYDPCISPDEDFIIFASSGREDALGKADLYYSKLNRVMQWENVKNIGGIFNTKTREYCPYITPDGKYFFFSSEGDIKWTSIEILKAKLK